MSLTRILEDENTLTMATRNELRRLAMQALMKIHYHKEGEYGIYYNTDSEHIYLDDWNAKQKDGHVRLSYQPIAKFMIENMPDEWYGQNMDLAEDERERTLIFHDSGYFYYHEYEHNGKDKMTDEQINRIKGIKESKWYIEGEPVFRMSVIDALFWNFDSIDANPETWVDDEFWYEIESDLKDAANKARKKEEVIVTKR